jgi:4a-hydroxytetrahydrobiopterin dehydratase
MKLIAGELLKQRLDQLGEGWTSSDDKRIVKEFSFSNFRKALAFTNQIGEIAETQGHHPDLELGWGRVKVAIMTHSADGITEKDFTLATAINELS